MNCSAHGNPPPAGSKLALHLANTGWTLTDCLLASGLLTRHGERELKFLHLTFEEYFAGGRLAAAARNGNWETTVPMRGRSVPVRVIIDKKGWHPRWREVIALTAGQLDPTKAPVEPLLEILTVCEDDIFHHRLCLAVLCLAESRSFDRTLAGTAARLSQPAWNLFHGQEWVWLADFRLGQYLCVADPPIAPHESVLAMIANLLRRPFGSPGRKEIVQTISRIGAAAGRRDVVAGLAAILREQRYSPDEWHYVLRAASAMGEAARQSESETFARFDFTDAPASERTEWQTASKVAGTDGADHMEILAALAAILRNPNAGSKRRDAADAVKELGAAAGQPEILESLTQFLTDPNASNYDLIHAAGAVGGIGRLAGQPEIIEVLATILRREFIDGSLFGAVAEACGEIGPVAGTLDILSIMVKSVCDEDSGAKWSQDEDFLSVMCESSFARSGAISALLGIGVTAGIPEFLDKLSNCPDPEVRRVLRQFVEWRWFERGGPLVWISVEALSKLPP